MLKKNMSCTLSEKSILETLINTDVPILLSDLSKKLDCDSNHLEQYLTSMERSGLVIVSRCDHEEEKYSPKRGKSVYSASPVAREYLIEKKRTFLTLICTLIAAIVATLTLIATIIIPFVS